jgi:dimethylhistidine N-methyltransferase
MTMVSRAELADVVSVGLLAQEKTLPAWLLYDDAGCALYDDITRLPEYYLTRAETQIFEKHGSAIVARAAEGATRIALAEIGAGTAMKTEILLEAAVLRQGSCVYLASDVSESALREAATRIPRALSTVDVRTVVGKHADIGPTLSALTERQVLLFIGSSIGNLVDAEATALLAEMRRSLRKDAVLVLVTDLKKDPRVLQAAYDDNSGVTATFSKNILARLNRELDAAFELEAFRHVAEWDPATSNVEVYLESQRAQRVWIGAFGFEIEFAARERIHTETCAKYDDARVDRILHGAGFARASTFVDDAGLFAVHLARVSP